MHIYEFGRQNKPTLLFFSGAFSHWTWYQASIDLLTENFHVIVPVLDGHDLSDPSDFISVEKTVEKVTEYLLEKGIQSIDMVYGLSIGGGMVLRILAEQRISIKKAIIDAGTAPYQMPYLLTRVALLKDYLGFLLLRSNVYFLKLAFDPKRWTPENTDEVSEYAKTINFLQGLSRKTIKNAFDSANNFKMPYDTSAISTPIEFWYGSQEKKSRARDMRYVRANFPKTVFKEIPNMEHGEYVGMYPKEFSEAVKNFYFSHESISEK